jgi:hypothetical protein
MLDKTLKNPDVIGLFSFIIGFGLMVIMFHKPIPLGRTLAISPSEFEGREVKADGKCYNYRVEDASCEIHSNK